MTRPRSRVEGIMTKEWIACYRTNYEKAGWQKYANGQFVTMPLGVLDAIRALCDEVERLNGWKNTAPGRGRK